MIALLAVDGANYVAAGVLLAIGVATFVLALWEQRRGGRVRKDYEVRRWRRPR